MSAIVCPRSFLESLFQAAVRAADPAHCLPPYLPTRPLGRTIVVGAGKAAASMARAVEDNWDGPISGLVVTRYDHGVDCRQIEVVEAAHPVPDERGLDAARRIKAAVQGLTKDDMVLCLISGGGSALLTMPGVGRSTNGVISLTLDDKQEINRALLRSGAPIDEMNTVRKHLSAIKGGRLALDAFPAAVVTLAISDVPGDDPTVIASGPTVADRTTVDDAIAVLDKYDIAVPDKVRAFFETSEAETAKAGDARLANCAMTIVARPQASLEAAAALCRDNGVEPVILGDAIEGEARHVAHEHAARATALWHEGVDRPVALISGGETTVTVAGSGRGGRNAEYLLGMAIALDGAAGIHAVACDTDGIDGSEDNAGAYLAPDSLALARSAGRDPQAMLDDNDGYSFFQSIDGLIKTGPTLTNVNDFRAVLVMPR